VAPVAATILEKTLTYLEATEGLKATAEPPRPQADRGPIAAGGW
jgi:hypothetical protein